MKRTAAFEGRFYPDSKEAIFKLISDLEKKGKSFPVPKQAKKVYGAVLPHAGHIFSGIQTIAFFKYLLKYKILPDTFILLHPNHTGVGPDIALEDFQVWTNVVGEVEIDQDISQRLPYSHDSFAQKKEHSAEVLIPFLQYYFPEHPFKIVPICMRPIDSNKARELARNIHSAVEQSAKSIMLIASSDFSHYLTPTEGRKMDDLVINKIMDKDIEGLENVVINNKITVCGYCPIMTLMAYTAHYDKDYKTQILARGHSGEVYPSHDVVDYITLMFNS